METGHDLTWVSGAPLWKALVKDRTKMRRPAILRFKSDTFMEELLGDLEKQPEKLFERILAPEADGSLKLFQPIHGHFHLVVASLVCQLPGLPDHAVDVAREEKAHFVFRRLADGVEWAWMPPLDAASPGAWKPLTDPEALVKGEELLPLLPGNFVEAGRRRRLLFGLVPTSSQESFLADNIAPAEDRETYSAANDGEVRVPKLGARSGARYVIRCVYRKPRCEVLERPLLSVPTEPFAIATYFDPDAPARHIRISLPMTFKGLMRAKKNVGIVVSDDTGDKVKQVVDGTVVKLNPLLTPPTDPCTSGIMSFSIPLLTVIAMILIAIVMALLALINMLPQFPGLKTCFPLNLKSKDGE